MFVWIRWVQNTETMQIVNTAIYLRMIGEKYITKLFRNLCEKVAKGENIYLEGNNYYCEIGRVE